MSLRVGPSNVCSNGAKATLVTSHIPGRRTRAWNGRRLAGILPVLLLLATYPAHADGVTFLEILGGAQTISKTVDVVTGTIRDIFGAGVDDAVHATPLYTLGVSSPTLVITATNRSFDLLLQQPNSVGEFQDNFPSVLSGITMFDSGNQSRTPGWAFKLTLKADINPEKPTQLIAQGFLQHLAIVHPDAAEVSPAYPIDYEFLALQNRVFSPQTFDEFVSKSRVHPNSPNHDDLLRADLHTRLIPGAVSPLDKFDTITFHLHGEHDDPPVPEPSTLLLFGTGILSLGYGWRHRQNTTRGR